MARTLLIFFFLTLSVALQAQQTTDTPRPGEGISTFLERNGRPSRTYYREFLRLNEKKLKGKHELKLGVKYILPPLRGKADASAGKSEAQCLEEPLFGKKLKEVQVKGNSLKGACFYIVSGHGGPDPGAIGRVGRAAVRIIIQDKKDGIRDDRYLKNSKRETCMGDAIPLNQVARLQQRCDKINELYAKDRKTYKYCRSVFLHVDSRGKGEQIDVFFYHAPGSKSGERMARGMKNLFQQKYDKHQPARGFEGTVSARKLYVLLHSTPPALYVELGNIQNTADQRRFVLSDNRQALANWMRDGLIKDFKK